MSVSKILCALGLVAAVSLFSVQVEAAQSRGNVSAEIKAACASGASASCVSLIKAKLELAAKLGKTPDGLAIAQGLGDAVKVIGKADPGLGTQLATIVAADGPNFVQVAFGAVLDGIGTASTGRRGNGRGGGDNNHYGEGGDNQGHGEGRGDCRSKKNCSGSNA